MKPDRLPQGGEMIAYGSMLTTALVWGVLFSATIAGRAEETSDTQSISFTKNVIVKQYKEGTVEAEPYWVKHKDTLWSILVKGYGIKERQFFFYCRMTKSLNPDLVNADHLLPDQLLLIPYKYKPRLSIPADTLRPAAASLLSARAAQIPTEEYTFSEGEHLAQVLRDIYNIPDDLIFDEYLEIVRKLNPALENLNLIKADQKILLPAASAYGSAAKKDESISRSVMPDLTDEATPGSSAALPDNKMAAGAAAQVFAAPHLTRLPPYLPAGSEACMSTLASLTAAFQGELLRLGDISLPLTEGSPATFDTAQVSVIQLTPGKKIIADYGGGLPAGIMDLVELQSGNYEVVTLEKQDTMRDVLDRLFDAAGYFAVDRSRTPLLVGGEVQYQISGDWIIYADEAINDIMVVNLIERGDLSLHPGIKEDLKRLGVRLIELVVGEEVKTDEAEKTASFTTQPETMPVITVRDSPELVDAVVDLLGQPCTKNYPLHLSNDVSGGDAADGAADRYYEKDGGRYILYFHPIAVNRKEELEGQGYHVLTMAEGLDNPVSGIKTLLDFLKVPSESPRAEFYDRPEGMTRTAIIVPGVLVKHDTAGDILLASSVVPAAVYRWLVDHQVKVFQVELTD